MKISSFIPSVMSAQGPRFGGPQERKNDELPEGKTHIEESEMKKSRQPDQVVLKNAQPYQSPEIEAAVGQLQRSEALTDSFMRRLKDPYGDSMPQLVKDVTSHFPYEEREKLLDRLKQQMHRSESGRKDAVKKAAERFHIFRLPPEIHEKILHHTLDLRPDIWLNTMDSLYITRQSELTKKELQALNLLTRQGNDMTEYTRRGGTVLSEALQNAHRTMFDYFMQFPPKRLPLNQLDQVHLTALDRAVMMGYKSAANALLAKGETVTPQTLKQAALWGQPEILKTLLERSDLGLSEDEVKQLKDGANDQKIVIENLRPLGEQAVQAIYEARLARYLEETGGQTPIDLEETEADFAALAKSNADIERWDEEMSLNPLHVAAQNGHFGIAQTLLRAGVDVDKRDGEGATALHGAVDGGHAQLAKMLLKATNPNAPDADGVTPLHMAARRGHLEIFRDLLGKGGRLRAEDKRGDNMLHHAAHGGNPHIIETVLQAKVPVNQGGRSGYTALATAAGQGHLPAVEKLLAWNADPNPEAAWGGVPLHQATLIGNLDIVNRLLDAGAKLDKLDSQCGTVLHCAVQSRNPQLVDLFLSLRVPVDSEARDGGTPLHTAALAGELVSIGKLVRAKANVNKTDRYGHTPLFMAVMGKHQRAVADLLKAGAKPDHWEKKDLSSGNRITPLHFAVENCDLAMVKQLLQAGADPTIGDTLVRAAKNHDPQIMQELLAKPFPKNKENQRDEFGMNALHRAAFCDNMPVLQLLMNAGFSVKTLDDHQGSALHWAAQAGSMEAVIALLEAGVQVDQVNDQDETALHRAVKYCQPNPTVPLLIEAGVPLNVKDKDGHTALYYATERHDPEAAQVLREHGAILA